MLNAKKVRRTVARDEAYTGPHANVKQTLALIQAHQNINVLLQFTTSQNIYRAISKQ